MSTKPAAGQPIPSLAGKTQSALGLYFKRNFLNRIGKVQTEGIAYNRALIGLARSFRNLEELNAQLKHWLDTVANPRVHATTLRAVNEAFAEERTHLRPLPLAPFRSVLKLERRISRDYMVSVGGNAIASPM